MIWLMRSPSLPVESWQLLKRKLIYAADKQVTGIGPTTETYQHLVVWMVLAGEAEVSQSDSPLTIPKGYGVVVLPGKITRKFSPGNRIISIRISLEWPTGEGLFEGPGIVPFAFVNEPDLVASAQALAAAAKSSGLNDDSRDMNWAQFRVMPQTLTAEEFFALDSAATEFCHRLIAFLLARPVSPHLLSTEDHRVLDTLRLIDSRADGPPATEAELAERVGVSRSHLKRLFLRDLGKSPAEIQLHKRRDRVRAMLLDSNLSAKEIACGLGFSSPTAFADWCKRHLGDTPGGIRREGSALANRASQ